MKKSNREILPSWQMWIVWNSISMFLQNKGSRLIERVGRMVAITLVNQYEVEWSEQIEKLVGMHILPYDSLKCRWCFFLNSIDVFFPPISHRRQETSSLSLPTEGIFQMVSLLPLSSTWLTTCYDAFMVLCRKVKDSGDKKKKERRGEQGWSRWNTKSTKSKKRKHNLSAIFRLKGDGRMWRLDWVSNLAILLYCRDVISFFIFSWHKEDVNSCCSTRKPMSPMGWTNAGELRGSNLPSL